MREGIAELNHPASELVMLRRVTDVANITYWMRCQGDLLDPKTAAEFDADLRTALGNTLGGEIPEHSFWQAGLAVKCGGLGLRSAASVAPLAFLSSRASSRPMVHHLFTIMEKKGMGKAEDYMAQYDNRSETCLQKAAEEWPE